MADDETIGPNISVGYTNHHPVMPYVRNAGPASLNLLPAEGHPAWSELRDLAFALATETAGLTARLAPGAEAAIGDLVRGMNCYYRNLIEGHDTRPIDIERALRANFVTELKRRDLQIEAATHIDVQAHDRSRRDGYRRQPVHARDRHSSRLLRAPAGRLTLSGGGRQASGAWRCCRAGCAIGMSRSDGT